MGKRAALTDFTAKKGGAVPSAVEAIIPANTGPSGLYDAPTHGSERAGQTIATPTDASMRQPRTKLPPRVSMVVRLSPEAHRQLRQLALDESVTAHDLLLEGVRDMFAKRRLPPVV